MPPLLKHKYLPEAPHLKPCISRLEQGMVGIRFRSAHLGRETGELGRAMKEWMGESRDSFDCIVCLYTDPTLGLRPPQTPHYECTREARRRLQGLNLSSQVWHQASYRPAKATVSLGGCSCVSKTGELCRWSPLAAFFETRLLQSSHEQETNRPAFISSFIQ